MEFKAHARGPLQSIHGLKTLEMKLNPVPHIPNQRLISKLMTKNVKEALQSKLKNTSYLEDPMNTSISKICQRIGTGEMSMELIGFHGVETNTFLSIVEVAGLMQPQVPSLIELILPETEHGLIFLYRLKY